MLSSGMLIDLTVLIHVSAQSCGEFMRVTILPYPESRVALDSFFGSHVFFTSSSTMFPQAWLGEGGDTDVPLRPEHSTVPLHHTNKNCCQL